MKFLFMIIFGLFARSNTVRLVGKRDYSYASTLINTGLTPCKTIENIMNSQNIICNKHNKKFN